ncbi:hypothetical protein AB6A40_007088 [Gnathostoma spinigerum]|uniref:PQ-loop repeat-containing protein n=1 Tax=Gnathostoma spinigerum TaxID=75299 RepID=A0ABD6EQC4_9BILA
MSRMIESFINITALLQPCPDGIQWIRKFLGDCVRTNVQVVGFFIGILSVILLSSCLIPQLYFNFRSKTCEGLSPALILFWAVGNSMCVIGTFFANQFAFQKAIAIFDVVQDMIMIGQYLAYSVYKKYSLISDRSILKIFLPLLATNLFILPSIFARSMQSTDLAVASKPQRHLMKYLHVVEMDSFVSSRGLFVEIGYLLIFISSVFFVLAQLPQIWLNYRRKSCKGLSMGMYGALLAGRVTNVLSIILQSADLNDFFAHFIWMMGTALCGIEESIVVFQYVLYDDK